MHNDRWPTTTTTTKLHSNNSNTKNKKINLDTFPVQFPRAQLRRQIAVRHTLLRCTPPVEASSDEEQYYIRSAWHLQSDIRSAWPLQSDVPLGRGILWPRTVLHHVILTFGYPLGQADIQSDVPPSRGIWWPRMVLSSKVLWVQIFVICCSHIREVSHTLQCRRMSTVIQYILVL